MTTFIERLWALNDQMRGGEARFWVNDGGPGGPVLNGAVTYPGDPDGTIEVTNYVGLVDEACGGMIAYGELDQMEELADALNALDVVERLFRGTHSPLVEEPSNS